MVGSLMRPCATSGCPVLVGHGHCEVHRRQREQRRGTRTQRGYDNRWLRYSQRRLLSHPFCVVCGRLAEVTDHIIAARRAPDRFWDESNHQSLCGACNRRKAIAEEGGLEDPYRPQSRSDWED